MAQSSSLGRVRTARERCCTGERERERKRSGVTDLSSCRLRIPGRVHTYSYEGGYDARAAAAAVVCGAKGRGAGGSRSLSLLPSTCLPIPLSLPGNEEDECEPVRTCGEANVEVRERQEGVKERKRRRRRLDATRRRSAMYCCSKLRSRIYTCVTKLKCMQLFLPRTATICITRACVRECSGTRRGITFYLEGVLPPARMQRRCKLGMHPCTRFRVPWIRPV